MRVAESKPPWRERAIIVAPMTVLISPALAIRQFAEGLLGLLTRPSRIEIGAEIRGSRIRVSMLGEEHASPVVKFLR
jgi:hypothetical protein